LKLLAVLILLCLSPCIKLTAEEVPEYKKTVKTALNFIKGKKVVSGEWIIKKPVSVERSGELWLTAGTKVRFDIKPTPQKEKTFGIVVHGKILINGTKEKPVIFSMRETFPEFYGIELESGIESRISFAHFERLNFPLHIHFTPITVENCVFKDNDAAIKLVAGKVVIQNNLFINNYAAMRFWYVNPVIVGNKFLNNRTGLFIRGGVVSPTISGNIFNNTRYDIKLSEGQETDIDVRHNQWRSDKISEIERHIYDKRKSDYLGFLKIQPVMKKK